MADFQDPVVRALQSYTTCDVSDALCKLKYRNGGFLSGLTMWSPLRQDGSTKIIGPAYTVKYVPLEDPAPKHPSHYIDQVPSGAVIFVSCPPRTPNAIYGGLMSTRAQALGAVGSVIDGRFRDLQEQRELAYPIFARDVGTAPPAEILKVAAVNVPVKLQTEEQDMEIRPGDYLVADINGVVVLPVELAEKALLLMQKQVEADEKMAVEIKKGMSFSDARSLKPMHLAQPPESRGDDLDFQINTPRMASASPSTANAYDFLDDVFGSGPDESQTADALASSAHGNPDISFDIRRLQAQHTTIGYREGIAAGKATSIQAGFDQGFALGANIGIRAGQILGQLEAIGAILAEAGPVDKSARVDRLLSQAAADLNPESVFTSQFWAPDGTWTYPVVALHEGGEIIYQDIADQHPLIAKWNRIAWDEAKRWHIDQTLPILESGEAPAQEDPAPEMSPEPGVASRGAIEW